MFIEVSFSLSNKTKAELFKLKPKFGFNGFGEAVYYRTYSRKKPNSDQETWVDGVIRVTEGIMEIRKQHYLNHHLEWDQYYWQLYARGMSLAIFKMEWLPPGRGLQFMGTDNVRQRGSAFLFNCGFVTTKDLIKAATWMFDMLMCGVGVGFDMEWNGYTITPDKKDTFHFVVDDSREGWVESLKVLLEAYIPHMSSNRLILNHRTGKFPIFNYNHLRPKGALLKTTGGQSSGPGPLMKLHKQIEIYLDAYNQYQRSKKNAYKQYKSSGQIWSGGGALIEPLEYKDMKPILPKEYERVVEMPKKMKIERRKYSQESLTILYGKEGFSALKKIGEEFGVTDRSSRKLIVEILRAQEERQRKG